MKKLLPGAALIMTLVIMLCGCQNPFVPTKPEAVEGGLVFMTGGEQGTYYRFGQVLAGKISEKTDTKLSVAVSGGSAENVEALQSGRAAIGFVQTDVLSYAWEGTRMFSNKADELTVIAELYFEQVQIVTMDPELRSVSDLKGKSVSVGAAGSGVYFNAMDILSAYGLTEHDINPAYQNFGDSVDALKSGKLDAAFIVAGAPTSAVSGLAATEDIYLISLDDEHIAKLMASSPHYCRAVISSLAYNTPFDTNTVAVSAALVAGKDASEKDVYNIISGIYENLDAITKDHSKGAELDLQMAAGITDVPYHPGAAKYFAEKGITVPVK